jgi:hypothetical protein
MACPDRIREDPDDEQSYYDPARNLMYMQLFSRIPEKSPHSDNVLTEVTGLACPQTPTQSRISASLSLPAEHS